MWKPILAISLGAAVGAQLRWQLGLKRKGLLPSLPPGTLAANLAGGYIIGFCGGLTTFSKFSAEVATPLQEDRLTWAWAPLPHTLPARS